MKIPFFGPRPEPIEPEPVTYASEFRDFLHNNAPVDFETKLTRARPFVFTSFVAWPMFWLYKGMEWGHRAQIDKSLVNYINRTFLQAKVMQFAIIAAGIMAANSEGNQTLEQINNLLRGYKRDHSWPRARANLGEEVRQLMNRKDMEEKIDAASPFLAASLIAWPTFWLYRGIEWHSKRRSETLQMYIRKTFIQAKLVQLAIISAGILFALKYDGSRTLMDVNDE